MCSRMRRAISTSQGLFTAFWAILLAFSFAVIGVAAASEVLIKTTGVKVVRNGNVVTVTARIEVDNPNASPVTNVQLIESDGTVIHVGNIPAKGKKLSAPYTFTADLGDYPSHYFGVPVTVQYAVNGVPVEQPWALTYKIR